MAAWRRAIELSLADEDTAKLRSIARTASRVERARILWPAEKTRRFLRSAGRSGCTIRRSSAASSARWSKARWLRSTIALVPTKETKAWIAQQPAHRFEFTFTPTHGSWLNLIEGFFSKLARSVLRH